MAALQHACDVLAQSLRYQARETMHEPSKIDSKLGDPLKIDCRSFKSSLDDQTQPLANARKSNGSLSNARHRVEPAGRGLCHLFTLDLQADWSCLTSKSACFPS